MESTPDIVFHLLIIGDIRVGKTSLMKRYADDVFSESYAYTIGAEFNFRIVEMDGKLIRSIMWDTAGQERFKALTKSYYRIAHGVILAFDLTDMESFQNLRQWFTDVDKYGGTHVAKMLVGTKSDMKDKRVISYEMGQEFANQIGIPYMETSAKNSTNVEQTFMTMMAQMKKIYDTGVFEKPEGQVLLDKGHEVGQKWSLSNMCNC